MFKYILGLFLILLFVGGGWFISTKVDSPLKSNDIIDNNYKCFAETHPLEAEMLGNFPKLGGVEIGEKQKYRVMIECRHLTVSHWVQFIDMADIDGQFDNNCDFSVYIIIRNGRPSAEKRTCMEAVADVAEYCMQNNLKVKDFLHKAPKVYVKPESPTQDVT